MVSHLLIAGVHLPTFVLFDFFVLSDLVGLPAVVLVWIFVSEASKSDEV